MAGVGYSDVDAFGGMMDKYSSQKKHVENIQNNLYKMIRKARDGEVNFDSKAFKVSVHLQENESYASILDREHLPDGDIMKEIFASFACKLSYGAAEATHFAGTRGHSGGRVGGKYLDDLEKSTLKTFLSGVNHDLYGNGRGFRASIDTATPGASSFQPESSMRIRPGMRFDWYDSTYTVLRGTIKIALRGSDRMARTTYIDAAYGTGAVPTGAVTGDKLVIQNALSAGEPSDGRYIAGLSRICDNSVLYGNISSSTTAAWQTTNLNASGNNITQEMLQLQWDYIYGITGRYPDKMVFNPVQKRAYLSNFLGQRQFTSNNFDTGASSLTFDPLKMGRDEKNIKPGQVDMVEDKDCDTDRIYIWDDECLCIGTDLYSTPTVADEDGTEWRKRIGYDSEQMFMRFWWNTVTSMRSGIGMIYNLNKPSSTM